jgi:catechol 2,3-dioxygenase-like lactoylglutathione lyase family enzyme
MSALGPDIPNCTAHVRFWGESGHSVLQRTCLLLTQSGHKRPLRRNAPYKGVLDFRSSALGETHEAARAHYIFRRCRPVKINGIAHIVLTVNRPELALPFYERLFGFLELKTVFRHERGAYFIGGKTAVAIVPAEAPHDQAAFVQTRIGLHHLCFRAYAREDVDRLHAHLCEMGAKIVHPPEDGPWAPGYYSVLFEDPDGIRLEVNHVPGKGLLTDEARFNPVGYDVES